MAGVCELHILMVEILKKGKRPTFGFDDLLSILTDSDLRKF